MEVTLEELVPHRPPMLLIDEVVHVDEKGAHCRVVPRPDGPFVCDGRVDLLIALEWMAQTAAVFQGMIQLTQDKPSSFGYLLGTRKMDFFADSVQVGQAVLVTARVEWCHGEQCRFLCRATDEATGLILAEGSLLVHAPPS